MSAIMNFLSSLAEVIFSAVEFLIGIVKDLLYIVGLLTGLMIKLPDMIHWLPSACTTLISTTFLIVLIYKILGREG